MLWLYILLGVLLLIFLVLLIPVGIQVKMNGESKILATIGFVKIQLVPEKEKKKKSEKKKTSKKKKQKKTEKAKKEPEKKKSKFSEKGLSWIVDIIKKAAELAKSVLKGFFKHIIVKKMYVSIRVAEEDAAKTAVSYGYYCSAIYPSVSILAQSTKCKHYGVDIMPDFNDGAETKYNVDFVARIRIIWIFAVIIKNGKRIFDIIKEFL